MKNCFALAALTAAVSAEQLIVTDAPEQVQKPMELVETEAMPQGVGEYVLTEVRRQPNFAVLGGDYFEPYYIVDMYVGTPQQSLTGESTKTNFFYPGISLTWPFTMIQSVDL